jgi:hypothetical protein
VYERSLERHGAAETGVLGVNGVRGNNEQGIFSICSKQEEWSHTLKCEGTRIWMDEISGKSLGISVPKYILEG